MATKVDYTAISQSAKQELPNISAQVRPVQVISDAVSKVSNIRDKAMKITLSELGFWKTFMTYGGLTQTGGNIIHDNNLTNYSELNVSYEANPPDLDRRDFTRDCVLRCGEYFLPLTVKIRVRAEKSDAVAQLVDGVEIRQRTAKKAKTIDLNFRLETSDAKMELRTTATNLAIVARAVDIPNESALTQVRDLSALLNDLYENQDIFEIENERINTDFGVQYVYIKDLDVNTTEGTTMLEVSLSLREVNMIENAVVFNDGPTDIDTNSTAGGGARL